jgi:hypothetical protein
MGDPLLVFSSNPHRYKKDCSAHARRLPWMLLYFSGQHWTLARCPHSDAERQIYLGIAGYLPALVLGGALASYGSPARGSCFGVGGRFWDRVLDVTLA